MVSGFICVNCGENNHENSSLKCHNCGEICDAYSDILDGIDPSDEKDIRESLAKLATNCRYKFTPQDVLYYSKYRFKYLSLVVMFIFLIILTIFIMPSGDNPGRTLRGGVLILAWPLTAIGLVVEIFKLMIAAKTKPFIVVTNKYFIFYKENDPIIIPVSNISEMQSSNDTLILHGNDTKVKVESAYVDNLSRLNKVLKNIAGFSDKVIIAKRK